MPDRRAIVANDLSYVYGSGHAAVTALDHVSLTCQRGLVHLIMGPSGSGKTTLLAILGCLLQPMYGGLRIMGQDVVALGESERARLRRRHIGFVYQSFRLFRALDAMENVLVALDIDGVRGEPARERALTMLADVGLEDKAHRKSGALSGGEKQRVAIARALVTDPDVILADEPTAALDTTSGMQVASILRDLAEAKNRAVVIVSHDHRLEPFADQILHLEDGRVRQPLREDGE